MVCSPLRRSSLVVVVLVAGLAASLTGRGTRQGRTPPLSWSADHETARFARCVGRVRVTCVVDGDTFWYHGEKIRVADINAPEIGEPRCQAEADLGARARQSLTELLNAGAFSLQPVDRDRDVYGRLLRTVTRGGRSLGAVLTDQGLAEPWHGYRRDWC